MVNLPVGKKEELQMCEEKSCMGYICLFKMWNC